MAIITDDQKELYKNKMEYPQEFIDRCLKVFPDNEIVKELLETKSFLLGSYIKNSIPAAITYEDIVEANKKCDFTEVARKNKERMDKSELFNKFMKLYDEQYSSNGWYIKDGKVHYNENVFNSYVTRHSLLRNFSKPVLAEKVPEYKPSKSLVAALDYNDACRAAGLTAAENHISD